MDTPKTYWIDVMEGSNFRGQVPLRTMTGRVPCQYEMEEAAFKRFPSLKMRKQNVRVYLTGQPVPLKLRQW